MTMMHIADFQKLVSQARKKHEQLQRELDALDPGLKPEVLRQRQRELRSRYNEDPKEGLDALKFQIKQNVDAFRARRETMSDPLGGLLEAAWRNKLELSAGARTVTEAASHLSPEQLSHLMKIVAQDAGALLAVWNRVQARDLPLEVHRSLGQEFHQHSERFLPDVTGIKDAEAAGLRTLIDLGVEPTERMVLGRLLADVAPVAPVEA